MKLISHYKWGGQTLMALYFNGGGGAGRPIFKLRGLD